jgi:hypothetical protein
MMTDAQMLQNLLPVYEVVVVSKFPGYLIAAQLLEEVIAALRRRIELEGNIS